MKNIYPVNYCLDKESDFEDYHPKFNNEENELLLSLDEIINLLDRCIYPDDNVGISFQSESKDKWDALEISAIDENSYSLQYFLSGCLYVLNDATKDYVVRHLNKIERRADELKSLGFKAKSI